MREAAITHELTDEIMKKKQLIEHLRNREQELEETLAAVRDGANAAKHQITVLLKEKVPIRKSHNGASSLIRAFFCCCRRNFSRANWTRRRGWRTTSAGFARDYVVRVWPSDARGPWRRSPSRKTSPSSGLVLFRTCCFIGIEWRRRIDQDEDI